MISQPPPAKSNTAGNAFCSAGNLSDPKLVHARGFADVTDVGLLPARFSPWRNSVFPAALVISIVSDVKIQTKAKLFPVKHWCCLNSVAAALSSTLYLTLQSRCPDVGDGVNSPVLLSGFFLSE